jgi:hypothetical protein
MCFNSKRINQGNVFLALSKADGINMLHETHSIKSNLTFYVQDKGVRGRLCHDLSSVPIAVMVHYNRK